MGLGDTVIELINPHLTLGTTDVSAAVSKVKLTATYSVNTTRRAGRKGPTREVGDTYDWQIDVTFQLESHHEAGELNATIYALMKPPFSAAGTGKADMILRALADAKGPTNPEWTGTLAIDSWDPLGDSGEIGQFMSVSKTFMGAGDLSANFKS